MDAVEVECAEVLVSFSETVKMNLDEVNEKECTEALSSFSKSVETEENLFSKLEHEWTDV